MLSQTACGAMTWLRRPDFSFVSPAFCGVRSTAAAAAILAARFAAGERDFLRFAETMIFAAPDSPYRALLRNAGCAYGDLERMLRADGLDGALRSLASNGVYLTVHELKGRVPIVRGSTVIDAGPAHLATGALPDTCRARPRAAVACARRCGFSPTYATAPSTAR